MALTPLHIEKQEYTPLIQYVAEEKKLYLHGKSIAEDALAFYKPLIVWADAFTSSEPEELTVDIDLEYFNTASSKMLYDILCMLNEAPNPPTFIWKYFEDDEDLQEYGEYLKEVIGDNFILKAVS